jgi:hypothetical protein
MHATTTIPRPRGREMGTALLIYAVTVGASMWIGAQKPATFGSALASSATVAAGTLTMAIYVMRWARYSRRAFLGAAALMAGGALAGPLVIPDPAAWTESMRTMLWMNPWYFMVMAWSRATSKPRWCAPGTPWAGALLVGTAAFLTLLSWGVALLALRI